MIGMTVTGDILLYLQRIVKHPTHDDIILCYGGMYNHVHQRLSAQLDTVLLLER